MKTKIISKKRISVLKILLQQLQQQQMSSSVYRFILVILIICLSLIQAQIGRTQTIYVDPCASGPERGTIGYPYKTLNAAVAAAHPGSVILMKGGLYPETLTINKALTINAYGGVARVGVSSYGVGWKDVTLSLHDGKSTNARVYYPSWSTGANTQIAAPCVGGFPMIVYVHGLRTMEDGHSVADLCDWCDDALRVDNSRDYLQAGGILKTLVASGFIAISFDWHTVSNVHYNQTTSPYTVDAIDYLISHYSDIVDPQRIGMIGHSTGGPAVMNAAQLLHNDHNPTVLALGLLSPAPPLHDELVTDPVLIFHGTHEHPCQVGTAPFEIYCMANSPKHLVVIKGANHFGYTDGICLDPTQQIPGLCTYDRELHNLMRSPGKDNPCAVAGLSGKDAHALQQLTAVNYLRSFFLYYLKNNSYEFGYIAQSESDEKCRHPSDIMPCDDNKTLAVYMWWPQNLPGNMCSSTEIQLRDGNGSVVDVFTVDQRGNGGKWNHLGKSEYNFALGASVKILPSTGCTVVADAVSFTFPGSSPDNGIIIDNSDTVRTVFTGEWNISTEGSSSYNGDYKVSTASSFDFNFGGPFSSQFNTADCKPVRYYNELVSQGVQVDVCSCTE